MLGTERRACVLEAFRLSFAMLQTEHASHLLPLLPPLTTLAGPLSVSVLNGAARSALLNFASLQVNLLCVRALFCVCASVLCRCGVWSLLLCAFCPS